MELKQKKIYLFIGLFFLSMQINKLSLCDNRDDNEEKSFSQKILNTMEETFRGEGKTTEYQKRDKDVLETIVGIMGNACSKIKNSIFPKTNEKTTEISCNTEPYKKVDGYVNDVPKKGMNPKKNHLENYHDFDNINSENTFIDNINDDFDNTFYEKKDTFLGISEHLWQKFLGAALFGAVKANSRIAGAGIVITVFLSYVYREDIKRVFNKIRGKKNEKKDNKNIDAVVAVEKE